MKKQFKSIAGKLAVIIGLALGVSCEKDTGNYSYIEINEAVVSNLDSLYAVNQGEVLTISPTITYTKDSKGDTSNYLYSWLNIRRNGFNSTIPQLYDSTSVFNLKMTDPLGLYFYTFRITDKKTNVWKEYPFQVLVANDYFEGWLMLSEINGSESRLDMLSYKATTHNYVFIPDVLAYAKSTLKLKGSPNFVIYDPYSNDPIIGTTEMATFLGRDKLNYSNLMDFSNRVETRTNVAIGEGSKFYGSFIQPYLWSYGNFYSSYAGYDYVPINKMATGNDSLFKASPYISIEGNTSTGAILFNESESEFVYNSGRFIESCIQLNNSNLFNNKVNKDLLYMKYVHYNGGETFALLKEKTGEKVYLARFTVGQQNYYKEIPNTLIARAEHFEINNEFGYIFYSIGGKLYCYDFNLKLNREVADYGNRKISLLKFERISFGYTKLIPRYSELQKKLAVCTYDPANKSNSGEMDIYSISPISGPIKKEQSYNGMGKIVSISYRFR